MGTKRRRTGLFRLLMLELVCLIALIIVTGAVLMKQHRADERLNAAVMLHHTSLGLADQLRHSSDDLTRMVRTYAATGDPRYKEFFYEILNIRDGKTPRPKHYDYIYWDFKMAEPAESSDVSGEAISLHKLMTRAGFSDEELLLLAEAQERSDRLVKLEETAMNAMSGRFPDKDGEFTIEKDPDRASALQLLFSKDYHQAKQEIMTPINEFLMVSDKRASGMLTSAQHDTHLLSLTLSVLLSCLLVAMTLFMWTGYCHYKRHTADLRESEGRFRATFEQAAMGIAHVSLEGRFLRINDKFCDIVGYKQDEMLAMSLQDVTDADLTQVSQMLKEDAGKFSVTERHLRKNGETIWVSLMVSMLRDEGGAPSGFIAVMEDTTERKRLRLERDRILETSQDLICTAGTDGYFKYVNPAWTSMGYTEKELLSKPFLTFIHPDDQEKTVAEVEKLAKGEPTVNFVNRYVDKEGRIHSLEWRATTIPDSGLILAIARDITKRQEASAERDALRDDIAHMSRVNAMGELSASLAHELNQPLGAILSNAQAAVRFMAMDPPDLDEVRDALVDIVDDDKRAGEIMRRLRQMVRDSVSEYELCNMRELIADVKALVRGEWTLHHIGVHTHLTTTVPDVMCDRVQIQQVILNLLTNAIEAMKEVPRDDRHMGITLSMEGSEFVKVAVRDSGAGLDADKIASVFEPFYSTKESGMGMGLAISRKIIERHGGKLWVESSPETETVFRFTLPCKGSSET